MIYLLERVYLDKNRVHGEKNTAFGLCPEKNVDNGFSPVVHRVKKFC
jgi:hypothetical protein